MPEEQKKKISEASKQRKPISETTRKKLSESQKGKKPSEETKKKISDALKGKPQSKEQKRNATLARIGGHRSEETKRKMSLAQKGERGSSWNGGITPLNRLIRRCDKYSEWKIQVFGRDNFTCQKCGKRGTWLEAHHIKPFFLIMKENNIQTRDEALLCTELWNLDNGITYCEGCHGLLSKKGGRL